MSTNFEGSEFVLRVSIKKKWQNCCPHMKKTEEKYWQRGSLTDEADSAMVIHFRKRSDCTSTGGEFWSLSENE
jgi:hypothetical protein